MVDRESVKQDAREAKEVLDSPVFQKAILELRKRWFGELMASRMTPEKTLELVAELRALEAVPQQLAMYVSNEKFAAKGK